MVEKDCGEDQLGGVGISYLVGKEARELEVRVEVGRGTDGDPVFGVED